MSSWNAALPGKARGASQNQAGCWELGAVTVTNYAMAALTDALFTHTPWQVFSPVTLVWMPEASKKAP